jgi:hypothetical protein
MYHSAMPEQQSAKSHAAVDPVHMGIILVLFANVIVACMRAFHLRDGYSYFLILVAIALLFAAYKTRSNALKVQDRLIRIEEQRRMTRLLPEPLLTQSAALTTDQYIGLRFASDGELAGLVSRTLAEGMDRKAIKAAVVSWRADDCRL